VTVAGPRVLIRIGPEIAHYPPGATFGPRTLRDFEFVWLLAGSARWECGDTHRQLRPGMLLLARPGMRDQFSWAADRASLHAFVHFRLASDAELGLPDSWPLTRTFTPADPIAALCRYALWLNRNPSTAGTARIADVVAWVLDLFVRGPMPAEHDSDHSGVGTPAHVARLADHIRRTWRAGASTALSLSEMAAAAGVSPGHLSRLFRAEYAIGPVAAVELVRLARSATLLQRSNLTVGEVATACGFVNPFHFSRRFRAIYGVPPRTYRTAHSVDDPYAPLLPAGLLPLAHRLLVEDAP
jgi:AraC family transcriptional regulator